MRCFRLLLLIVEAFCNELLERMQMLYNVSKVIRTSLRGYQLVVQRTSLLMGYI